IFRSEDLSKVAIPQFQSYKRHGQFPIYRGEQIRVVIFGDRHARPVNSTFQWKQQYYGSAAHREELTPDAITIREVPSDYCRYGVDHSGNVIIDLDGRIIQNQRGRKGHRFQRLPGIAEPSDSYNSNSAR